MDPVGASHGDRGATETEEPVWGLLMPVVETEEPMWGVFRGKVFGYFGSEAWHP